MINVYNALGIMSGTSLDGLDLALTTFQTNALNKWSFTTISAKTIDYPNHLAERLKKSILLSGLELIELQNDWTEFVVQQVLKFKNDVRINIDLIGNHGHTIFHQTQKQLTFQLANNAALAVKTGIKVVGDFRSGDVALGGQGAPLVPIGDQLLFHEYDACINLGGIANISFGDNGKRIAYDCCPFNIPLNIFAAELGLKYDEGGKLAANGSVDETLFNELKKLSYFRLNPPKSLGIEWINSEFLPILEKYELNSSDKLATLVEFYAHIIAKAMQSSKAKTTLITGGGAYNHYFIERLSELSSTNLIVPDAKLIEFKEAIIFGFLGVLRIREEENTISSVTGAQKSYSSGGLYLP